ncbi:MAG: hypothetical protein AAGI17_07455 [Planctomycetota bacterium]
MTPLVTLAALTVGPIAFDRAEFLLLILPLAAAVLWIGRKSLSGLGGVPKRVALGVRIAVIVMICAALAEPSLRRVSKDAAVIAVIDASRSVPVSEREAVDRYVEELALESDTQRDWLGVVTVGREALVQSLPSIRVEGVERQFIGRGDATDLAAGVRMAMAIAPEDTANRILLASDGNETAGSLLAAAEAARADGVQIDVLPIEYEYPAEVIVDRVVAPTNARGGETLTVSVVLTSTGPATGRLVLTENGDPIDLDPDPGSVGLPIELTGGKEVIAIQVEPTRPGPRSFEAIFEPVSADGTVGSGDSILENNRATGVTFVGREGWVLLVGTDEAEYAQLRDALIASGIRLDIVQPSAMPSTLTELNAYEAVVITNQPSAAFTYQQQEELRRYIEDSGGGLLMTGGPDAFGAGGWIGSPIEDALPIRLDPPNKRQMPRGALALVVHSVEAPRGTYWGKQTANAAVDVLSSRDLVGIVEFQGIGGTDWVYPISPVGDRTAVRRAINNLQFGDMPSFDPSMRLALADLSAVNAGQKHVIVISDGDPSLNRSILGDFRNAGISISTVGVFPHSAGDFRSLQTMANATGGQFYGINNNAQLATLPQIFIKEAQTVRRTLIWEGDPFNPGLAGIPTPTLQGIGSLPPITGYVVAAEREGLAQTTAYATQTVGEGQGAEEVQDPIAAQWQYGLGRVVAITTDAGARWGQAWAGWPGYRQFWEQHVRWTMRPTGSANLRVVTQQQGDQTEIIIDLLDDNGERINFASFDARIAAPTGKGESFEVRQTGPGRYVAVVDTEESGDYISSLRYRAPNPTGGPAIEGSVQAAITRPVADEFRALETNAALLRQVAAITGGRVLDRDPTTDDPWRREGLREPVSARAIWLAVTLVGIGLFLADVAVRRVRIEPAAIASSILGLFRGGKQKQTGQDLGALRTAKRRTAERTGDEHRKRATKKFEVTDADVPAGPIALSGEAEQPASSGLQKDDVAKRAKQAKNDEDAEGGMSRLMKAKRRARDEFGQE